MRPAPARRYYVSWIDPRTDPWPLWHRYTERAEKWEPLSGLAVSFLQDGLWAGMPLLHDVPQPAAGRAYDQPGVGLEHEGRHCRVYVGTTITALFHPASQFADLTSLARIYLLHLSQDRSAARLEAAARGLHRARHGSDLGDKLCLTQIEGVADPNNHDQVLAALKKWLADANPFRSDDPPDARPLIEINVNLSPCTETMGVCWLLLNWNGLLGDQPTSLS
jgi:hypothetical protein